MICAPVYTAYDGLATQIPVGTDEGLKHDSSIHCDELVSLPKSVLTLKRWTENVKPENAFLCINAHMGQCGIGPKSGEGGEGDEGEKKERKAGAQFYWGIVGGFEGIFKGYVGGDILRREDGKRACQDGLNMGEAAIAVGNGGVWAGGNGGRGC